MFSFDLQVRFADAERTKRIVALWYTKYWYFLDMNYISIGFVEMFYAKLPPIGREEFADSQYFVYREEELTSKVLTILTFLIDSKILSMANFYVSYIFFSHN